MVEGHYGQTSLANNANSHNRGNGFYRENGAHLISETTISASPLSIELNNANVRMRRLLRVRQAEEAAAAEKQSLRDLEAAATEAAAAQVQRQLDAEIVAMALEHQRSRKTEEEMRAAETALREREKYLRDLYTSFVPLWREETSGTSPVGVPREEGEEEEGGEGIAEDRRGAWWTGADAPKIWSGPSVPCPRLPKTRPGPRFVPHARALLDGLDPQHVSLGRLSREYLALLDLPHESIRDMYDKVSTPF